MGQWYFIFIAALGLIVLGSSRIAVIILLIPLCYFFVEYICHRGSDTEKESSVKRVRPMGREKVGAFKTALMILSFYLGFWLLFGFLLGDSARSELLPSSVVPEEIAHGFVVIFLLRAARRSYSITFSEMGLTYHMPWLDVFFGLLLGGALWLVAGVISDKMKPIIPDWTMVPQKHDFAALYISSQGIWRVILFFIFGFTTPVIEELFFRGLIHSVLRRAFSIPVTLVLSSAVFGLFHVYLDLAITMFLIGGGLTLIREWGKSLLAPIIAHATINCLTLVFS